VWYAISSGGVIGAYFFEDEEGRTVTLNTAVHGHAGYISMK
jgi:hypothetical protein